MGEGFGELLRSWCLALLALAVLLFCYCESGPSRVAGADASPETFSSARAEAVLARLLGPERPHPVGSLENAAVRGRVLSEFATLGVPAHFYRAFTCNAWRRLSYVACATVTDVVAEVVPGSGKAIILLAHYDSVPAGPGASDDESGVATVLETVRALKARATKSLHPVWAVITDGEEGGLLGANAILQNAGFRANVGVVVNVEARGTRGPSLLFQTSPGDGRLIDLYAANVSRPETSSLYAEIYRFLPNDTDLTLFIRDGFPSFNFAFADNVRYYHSPLDLRRNLDPATLQMHGDNMLGVASALEKTSYDELKGGNDVYLTIFGTLLPRVGERWVLPLALLAFLGLAIAAWLARAREPIGWGRATIAAVVPLLLLIGSGLFGWLLSVIAQIVSGHPDPTYAYPIAMRVGLGFGVWTIALLVSRLVKVEVGAAASWLWIAGLGIVMAAFLPGFSPYFVFPSLVAAVLLLIASRSQGGWSGTAGQVALLASALAMFIIWLPLVVSGETLMGLRLHPMFTIPAALAISTVVPLLAAWAMTREGWNFSWGASAIAALACSIVAGLLPAYSALSPQRVNLVYFESGTAPARFIADTSWKGIGVEPIPEQLVKAGPFKLDPNAWQGLLPSGGYTAPAGASRFPLPQASVLTDHDHGATRTAALRFTASLGANGMIIDIPGDAKLVSLDLRGQHFESHGYSGDIHLVCLTGDCRDLAPTFVLANKGPVTIPFAELRYGLPDFAAKLQGARPVTAMASQSGDEVVLANRLTLGAP